jgi:hypothetical protein
MEIGKKKYTDKLELLKDVMYNMFLEGVLPDLDMTDFFVMWKALILQWDIKIDDNVFDAFIDDINTTSSDRYDYFTNVFNIYFT